jgi:hypothetical protein
MPRRRGFHIDDLTASSIHQVSKTQVLGWRSATRQDVFQYLWKSRSPAALNTLHLIIDTYSAPSVIQAMRRPTQFITLILNDPVIYQGPAWSAASSMTRRRAIADILSDITLEMHMFPPGLFSDLEKTEILRVGRFELDPDIALKLTYSMPFIFVARRPYRISVSKPRGQAPPRAYVKGISTKGFATPLTVGLMGGYVTECTVVAFAYMDAMDNMLLTMHWTEYFREPMRIAVMENRMPLFETTMRVIEAIRAHTGAYNPVLMDSSWHEQGYTVLHAALIFRRPQMAKMLLLGGVDPRYPFAYVRSRGSRQPLVSRRGVVPTKDLAMELRGVPGVSNSTVDWFIKTIPVMERYHASLKKAHAKKPGQRRRVSEWTTGKYRNVQNTRRGPVGRPSGRLARWLTALKKKQPSTYEYITKNLDPTNKITSRSINDAVSSFMKHQSLRAPRMPREMYLNSKTPVGKRQRVNTPTALFRGVHGPIATELKTRSTYRDHGFVATSTDPSVARGFGGSGVVMIFPIETIPKGTPWIWFSSTACPQSNTVTSYCDEKEVLLPPGTYTLVAKMTPGVWEARYAPDMSAIQ